MSVLRKKIAQNKVPPSVAGAPSASSSSTAFPPCASLALQRKDTPVPTGDPFAFQGAEESARSCFSTFEYLDINAHKFAVYHSKIESAETVMVFVHGAGMSAMSWALVAEQVVREGNCGVLAFDVRGHGLSSGEGEEQWDITTLCDDTAAVVQSVFSALGVDPRIVLIGHSMGGAIAARCAHHEELSVKIAGLVVLDVVEGTAMEALPAMRSVLEKRPSSFGCVQDAISWSISSGTVHNRASAVLSMPSQLIEAEGADGAVQWVWRTNLFHSEPFWPGWFTGLSKKFLDARVPKQLVLAGTDRLDTELMIGQMQGKFQVVLLPACGHAVQEDAPDQVATALLGFLRYNNL